MDKKDITKLLNRLSDYTNLARNKYTISTTRFLNPYEQSLCVAQLSKERGVEYTIFGGYENSERNIIIISPASQGYDTDDYLSLVRIDFTKYDTKYINHRMILGSILSLGITRDGIGDIILDEDSTCAYVIAKKNMAVYINDNLLQVARARVTTEYIDDISGVNLNIKEPKIISGTVASLRIDSILALALKTSRSKANELIKEQLIFINWQLVTKPTAIVKENDKITVRRKGRIVLKSIGNTSKKNRIWVELQVFD